MVDRKNDPIKTGGKKVTSREVWDVHRWHSTVANRHDSRRRAWPTTLASIPRDLGGNAGTLQWMANAYNIAFGAGIITAAALGDRLGRRRAYLCGLALFTTASAACALAPDAGTLVAVRAVQEIGAAGAAPKLHPGDPADHYRVRNPRHRCLRPGDARVAAHTHRPVDVVRPLPWHLPGSALR
jgi:hypothetical protein